MKSLSFKRLFAKQSGFTLLELLIAMSMLAILVGIAAPSMRSFLLKNAVQADQRELLGDLSVARAKAIESNTYVSICGKNDAANTCNSSADWSNGWIVFVDGGGAGATSGNGLLEGDEEIVRINNYQGANSIVVQDDSSGTTIETMGFDQRGYMNTTLSSERMTILVCDPDSDDSYARAIFLEQTGRSVGSRDTDGNGTHEDLAGGDLSC